MNESRTIIDKVDRKITSGKSASNRCQIAFLLVLKNIESKGLVIFNPAARGWSTGEGVQHFLKTCLK